MPIERIGDPDPDLVEGCGRFCKERFEVHRASPSTAASGAAASEPAGGIGDDF
jgi:hypothetical protein